jgi:hypothetical protein
MRMSMLCGSRGSRGEQTYLFCVAKLLAIAGLVGPFVSLSVFQFATARAICVCVQTCPCENAFVESQAAKCSTT